MKKREKSLKLHDCLDHLVYQNKHTSFVKEHQRELDSAYSTLNYLVYNYVSFQKIEEKAWKLLNPLFSTTGNKSGAILPNTPACYEKSTSYARGYLNEIGNLEKKITSDWLGKYIDKIRIVQMMPSFLAIIPLRHKWSAHSARDYPHSREKECDPTDLRIQNDSISNLDIQQTWIGTIGSPGMLSFSIDVVEISRHRLLKDIPLIKGIEKSKNALNLYSIDFIPSLHHPKIEKELINFFENIFQKI